MAHDFLAVGWDQSLNHGAAVALNRAGFCVFHAYLTSLAAYAGPKYKCAKYRLPPTILKDKDDDNRSILRLAFLRLFYQQVCGKVGCVSAGRPVYLAIESYPFHKVQGAHQIGEGGGLLRIVASDYGFLIRTYDPKTVKSYCTGNGNSTSADLQEALTKQGKRGWLEYGTGVNTPGEDLAVASALADMVRTEVLVRQGEIGLATLEDRERAIFLRVTKANPVNLLDRPFVNVPANAGSERGKERCSD
jgi:Holliday junction resolvasome RuvABC endonuclease subunit